MCKLDHEEGVGTASTLPERSPKWRILRLTLTHTQTRGVRPPSESGREVVAALYRAQSAVVLPEPVYVAGPPVHLRAWLHAVEERFALGGKADRTTATVARGLASRGAFSLDGRQRRGKTASAIAADSSLTTRTVERHMARLRELGYVAAVDRVSLADGMRSTALYQLHVPLVLISVSPSPAAVVAMSEWRSYAGVQWVRHAAPWATWRAQPPRWASAEG